MNVKWKKTSKKNWTKIDQNWWKIGKEMVKIGQKMDRNGEKSQLLLVTRHWQTSFFQKHKSAPNWSQKLVKKWSKIVKKG